MEKKEEIKTRKKKTKEIFIQLLPLLRDLIPIFLERIAEIQGKPTLLKLQEENEKLKDNMLQIEKKMQWFLFFIIMQTIFIIIIFIYVLFKL
ncbi:MAG: hypothetical protein KatS3mg129_0916 [Leptospiraceae bacterium]|nr:MAG: hypothetical protein KatS3mg129_0916 [Leptospiraceae bacterium]